MTREFEKKILGWRAWFVAVPEQQEILRFSSLNTGLSALPGDGMLGWVLYEPASTPEGNPTRLVLSGYDYYFAAQGIEGLIYGCDVDVRQRDVWHDIHQRYRTVYAARGIWTDYATIKSVESEMNEAKTWP